MNITRNGEKFTLTDAELYQAYAEQKHLFLLEDAERHLFEHFGIDEDDDNSEISKIENAFFAKYGFTLNAACQETDSNYLLEDIVSRYEHDFDCNVPENVTWNNAVQFVLHRYQKD